LKYSLTPSLTLDATFNTDFAQVEVDEQQVNLTRFDLFFPEKRPFFLENSGTFDFGAPRETEIFFSRRIGIDESGAQIPIDAGIRLSGHAGRYDIDFLNMKTLEVGGIAPANNFTVARIKRELPNRSSVGVIAVSRSPTLRGSGLLIAPLALTPTWVSGTTATGKTITPGPNRRAWWVGPTPVFHHFDTTTVTIR